MSFISLEFLCFLPAVLFFCRVLSARFRWILLLLASYFFYMCHAPWTGLLLFGTTFVSWICAGKIAQAEIPGESQNGCRTDSPRTWKQKLWLALGIAAPLSCLFFFKYMGFMHRIGSSLIGLLGGHVPASSWDILLPVGISFYTFQTLSYVIEVYRKDLPHETHFGYYALFVSFFPQLVAGPIERPGSLLPQLKQKYTFQIEDLRHGFRQILSGFFKKIVVADYLAGFADAVFAAPDTANGPGVVLAVCFFAVQIYCDFSGYCDIATGTAGMLGIRLMKNFDHPYSADSIRDFWHRWHISLTSWFTDYIYIPLGGSRRGFGRHLFNVMLVFFISGLWHGAAWHYVVWGCIHGFYLICGIVLRRIRQKAVFPQSMIHRRNVSPQDRSRTKRSAASVSKRYFVKERTAIHILKRIWTLTLVCFAWIFFRAQTLSDAFVMVSHLGIGWNMSGIVNSLQLMGLAAIDGIQIVLVLLVLTLLDKYSEKAALSKCTIRQTAILFYLVLTIAVGWLMLLSQNTASTFLYFQF